MTENPSNRELERELGFFYHQRAGNYNGWRAMQDDEALRECLFRKLGIKKFHKVLEIGGGAGYNIPLYPHARYFLLDLNESMLECAAFTRDERSMTDEVSLVRANACYLPFPDDSMDIAIMTHALSAIPDNRQALSEAIRVVRTGGRIGILDFPESEQDIAGGVAGINLSDLVDPEESLIQMEYAFGKNDELYIFEVYKPEPREAIFKQHSNVPMGAVFRFESPDVATSLGIANCLGVAVYDRSTKVGYLAHISLVDYEIPEDIDKMLAEIRDPSQTEVTLCGLFPLESSPPVLDRLKKDIRAHLENKCIGKITEQYGEGFDSDMTMTLDAETGEVTIDDEDTDDF